MRIGNIAVKRRVWVTLICAMGASGAWWGWALRTSPELTAIPEAKTPFVRLAGVGTGAADQVLRERADLFDPTPLFFPTEWNYGQRPLRERLRRQPGQAFGSFEPVYTFAEQNMKSYGAETTPPPERLSDVLRQGNEAPFAGIGQIDAPRSALPERAGFIEVRRVAGEESIISQELKSITPPRLDYAPLEFLIIVGSAGVIGEPVLTSGSGWEEVDAFFLTSLVKTFRLGERLNPGRYRILVGP